MIIQEIISETLVRTYSDRNVMIHGGFPEGDYAEAIDPISAGRTYTETNIPIPAPEMPEGLQEAAEYLLKTKAVEIVNTDEDPDYFHEHEPEPDYFG
jgi:hypothetical protein